MTSFKLRNSFLERFGGSPSFAKVFLNKSSLLAVNFIFSFLNSLRNISSLSFHFNPLSSFVETCFCKLHFILPILGYPISYLWCLVHFRAIASKSCPAPYLAFKKSILNQIEGVVEAFLILNLFIFLFLPFLPSFKTVVL